MKQQFDDLCFDISRLTTQKYSSSFSLGIRALKPSLRPAIYAIYGFVRLADEIVDSFTMHNKQELLLQLQQQMAQALKDGISLNPILNAFQATVHRYKIDNGLIQGFLKSMQMDLQQHYYSRAQYQAYIYGSAEVVGLMCLKVFLHQQPEQYTALSPYAMRLGTAFQKINFLRDMQADFQLLGRNYFPDADVTHFTAAAKQQIEAEIAEDLNFAFEGIKKLPASSKFGVYLAYRYYHRLFDKLSAASPQQVLQKRIRLHTVQKAWIALGSYIRFKAAGI